MPPQNKSSRNDASRIVFFFVAIGLAAINIWFASRAITMGGGGDSFIGIAQRPPMTSKGASRCDDRVQPPPSPRPTREHNFTIGICAIVRDGEAYLTEWLDYHLDAMRIENAYVYDNSYFHDLRSWHRNTRNHPLYRRVEVRHISNETSSRQRLANTDCVLRYGRNVPEDAMRYNTKAGWWNAGDGRTLGADEGNDYLALIDIDEFLVPRGGYETVHGVVEDYLAPFPGASLSANWMLFGSANKTVYSPVPVTKRFQYRDDEPSPVVKAIARASEFYSVRSPHAVNSLYGHAMTTSFPGARLETKNGATDPNVPSNALLLYHYRYTSHKEYFHKKCVRMDTDGNKGCSYRTGRVITAKELEERGMPNHIAMRTGTVFDDSAWRLLKERVPKYAIFDDEMAWGDYTAGSWGTKP